AASDGERSGAALLAAARAALRERGVEPEYVELVDPDTLEPCDELTREALLLIAARIGDTRLIDNALLRPSHAPPRAHTELRRPEDHPPRQPHPRKALA
ncbi:MAG TPA: pantoate--beta-alanine ligase, partial [Solirubrobacteraceae bacterium]